MLPVGIKETKKYIMSEAIIEEKDLGLTILKDETFIVKYINNFRNGVTDPNHSLYGGLTNQSFIGIPAPINTDRHVTVKDIFTAEELDFLSKELKDPGVKDINSDFWKDYKKDQYGVAVSKFPIRLKKEGVILNTKDALDFIYVRILQNCPFIALDEEAAEDKDTYRFLLINQSDVRKTEMNHINAKSRALIQFGKISEDVQILSYIMKAFGFGVDDSRLKNRDYIEFLQREVFNKAEKNINEFLFFANDPLIKEKILLGRLSMLKLINKRDNLYFDLNMQPLKINDEDSNNEEGAAKFLASALGQEFRVNCETQLKARKEASNK